MLSGANRLIKIIIFSIIINSLIGNIGWLFGHNLLVDIIRYVNVILLYLSIGILLWWGKVYLTQNNLDRAALILLVLAGIFRTRLINQFDGSMRVLLFLLTLPILVALIKYWRYIPKNKWRWVGIGILSSMLVIPLSIIESYQPNIYIEMKVEPNLGIYLIRDVIYNLSFVAIIEELVFRGLLWGYLRGNDWKESRVIWVQAILFWLTHVWQISNPITFFITIPIGTIIFSLLTRYSKQVFPSIIAHTIMNTAGPLLVYYL